MVESGSRKRNQPAPPHAVFEALIEPNRDPARPWLLLLDDEHRPQTMQADKPQLVVWTSIWNKRPDALTRFDLRSDNAAGTDLRWTLLLAEPFAGAIAARPHAQAPQPADQREPSVHVW
jgi:hypothetical protein